MERRKIEKKQLETILFSEGDLDKIIDKIGENFDKCYPQMFKWKARSIKAFYREQIKSFFYHRLIK